MSLSVMIKVVTLPLSVDTYLRNAISLLFLPIWFLTLEPT